MINYRQNDFSLKSRKPCFSKQKMKGNIEINYYVHLCMSILKKIIGFPIILLVRVYQLLISPIFPANCRFTPTCSHYMIEAITIWGPFKGFYLGLRRIASCHPYGKYGHDPVPEKKEKIK